MVARRAFLALTSFWARRDSPTGGNISATLLRAAIALGVLAVAARMARADDGHIVAYTSQIEKGEWEIMLMNDLTFPSLARRNEGQNTYFSQMLEVEYYPTNQLALEVMWEAFEDTGTGFWKYTGARYEARYRLFEEKVPLNPMLYVEYEDLDPLTRYKMEVSGWVIPPYAEPTPVSEPRRESILETRLILSQPFDHERWNVAFNWINETDLNNSGLTAFGYALGLTRRFHGAGHGEHGDSGHEDHEHEHNGVEHTSYETSYQHEGHAGEHGEEGADHPLTRHRWLMPTSAGVEFDGALGDTRAFGIVPSRQEHYVVPNIMFHTGKHTMCQLAVFIGLTGASDNLLRANWMWHF